VLFAAPGIRSFAGTQSVGSAPISYPQLLAP
jgi:hypothetical protein